MTFFALRALGMFGAGLILSSCGRYQNFTLPPLSSAKQVRWEWHARPDPVMLRGLPGVWDSVDLLNPSVVRRGSTLLNYYSGFDGIVWQTGLATSSDGITWQRAGKVLSPDRNGWDATYIAANGSAVNRAGQIFYFYQGSSMAQIGLARSPDGRQFRKENRPILPLGPYGSWDERGAGDPYVIELGGRLFLFYEGMDRSRRQRLGVAYSEDGAVWQKLRSNPVLEPGPAGSFDERGLGEPAVWAEFGSYWMLYTGRDRQELRKLGLARSQDGNHWEKLNVVIAGEQAWDSKVICDPTVLLEGGRVRVWFGGGDVASPDENLHGQIGYGELTPVVTN